MKYLFLTLVIRWTDFLRVWCKLIAQPELAADLKYTKDLAKQEREWC